MAKLKNGMKVLQCYCLFEMPSDFKGSTVEALQMMLDFHKKKEEKGKMESIVDFDTDPTDFVNRLWGRYIDLDEKLIISSEVIEFNEKEITWNPLTSAFDDVPGK